MNYLMTHVKTYILMYVLKRLQFVTHFLYLALGGGKTQLTGFVSQERDITMTRVKYSLRMKLLIVISEICSITF